jgi:hypothetical protein
VQVPDEVRTTPGTHAYRIAVEVLGDGHEDGMDAGTAVIESPIAFDPDGQRHLIDDPTASPDLR